MIMFDCTINRKIDISELMIVSSSALPLLSLSQSLDDIREWELIFWQAVMQLKQITFINIFANLFYLSTLADLRLQLLVSDP